MSSKSFKISLKTNAFLVTVKGSNLLVFGTDSFRKKYIKIPSEIGVKYEDSNLVFYLIDNTPENLKLLKMYEVFLGNWIKLFEKTFKKQLILKGLGFKANFSEDNSKIELKVGFSHIVSIDIPKNDVQVSINNNLILIEGSDPSIVGNYAARIRNIKIPDSYKGKGFWYKNEKKSLKEIKKA
jgi:large subunit ribosomal protein L6